MIRKGHEEGKEELMIPSFPHHQSVIVDMGMGGSQWNSVTGVYQSCQRNMLFIYYKIYIKKKEIRKTHKQTETEQRSTDLEFGWLNMCGQER